MTTIYQIGNNSYACKDMVFGWCVVHEGRAAVIDQMDSEQLDILSEVLPNTPLLVEVWDAIHKRRYELSDATSKEKRIQELQALKNKALEEERSRLKRIAEEQENLAILQRRNTAISMETSMRAWFGNLSPAKVYEVKNENDGYVYCRVVPVSTGYVVLDSQGVVKSEHRHLADVVSYILRHWW